MTASGYSPYGAGAQSGFFGVCRANNAMGVTDVADERRMTASGYSPYGAGAQSGFFGVCRANNAMGVIRRCRG